MIFFREANTALRRSAGLVALVVAAVSAMVTGPSSAQTPPSLGTVTITVFPGGLVNTPTSIMVKKGFLAKYGVKAELTTIPSGPGIVASLVGGSSDLADIAPGLSWPLVRQGQCLKYLTGGLGNVADLVAQPDFPLPNLSRGFPESIKDLKGTRIGVVALGSGTHIWVQMLLKSAGMSPKDVTFIAVGANATAVAAFQQKLVDVLLVYPPIYQTLQQSPGFQMVANWTKGSPPTLDSIVQSGIGTTCAYANAHPQIIEAVCKASAETYAYMLDPKNEAEIGAYTAENMGVSKEQGLALWNQYKSSFHGIAFTQAQWEAQGPFTPDGYVPKFSDLVIPGCAM